MAFKTNEVRMYEAYITKRFLKENKEEIESIFDCFCDKVRNNAVLSSLGTDNFYLKGGNGYDLLKEITACEEELVAIANSAIIKEKKERFFSVMKGDFDFQLIPDYEHGQKIEDIDAAVIDVLKQTTKEYFGSAHNTKEAINLNAFQFQRFPSEPEDEFGQQKSDIINMSHEFVGNARAVNLTDHVVNVKKIGEKYRNSKTMDILKSHDLIEGRLNISSNEIMNEKINTDSLMPVEQNHMSEYPFTIYVNYTIPEFILYRLVFRVPMENKRTIEILGPNEEVLKKQVVLYLKSEIIDISVPRQDSIEIMLDSTMSPRKIALPEFYPFGIPGWEYHFCENLNLLQENYLGISGSPWKKGKRIARGQEALNQLKTQYKDMKNFPIGEDATKEYFENLDKVNAGMGTLFEGYGKMYTHNIKTLPITADAKAYVSNLIIKKMNENYASTSIAAGVKNDIDKLAKFCKDVLTLEVENMNDVEKCVNDIKYECGCVGTGREENFIRLITPLPKKNAKTVPMNIVVFRANKSKKDQIEEVLNKLGIYGSSEVAGFGNYGAFSVGRIRCKKAVIFCVVEYVHVESNAEVSGVPEVKYEDVLRNSYFVAQRVALIDMVRPH